MTLNERKKLTDTVIQYIDHLIKQGYVRIRFVLDEIKDRLLTTNMMTNRDLNTLVKFMEFDLWESKKTLRDRFKPLTVEFVEPVSSLNDISNKE